MATRKITTAVNVGASSDLPGQVRAARQVLQVVSKRDGFRRAGREWHGTTTVGREELTDEQLALLKAEPMLVVLEVDAQDEPMAWSERVHLDESVVGNAADTAQASEAGTAAGTAQA